MARVIRDFVEAADLQQHDYIHDALAPGRVRSVNPTSTGAIAVVVRLDSGTDIFASHPPTRKLDVSRRIAARRHHLRLVEHT
ncbi:hypothetical protein [Nonomuraea sp. NPDC049646]|uniref:hypothetical protein n=1 Tax=unclassified Nonomuraea TaxID=2593643 RepID=UPI0037B5E663